MFFEENPKNRNEVKSQPIPPVPSDANDRRYIPRWEVKNRVLYFRSGQELCHECASKDINCMGACICTDEDLPLHEKINLTIYLAEGVSISVMATVIWEKYDGAQRTVGLHFENVPDKVRDIIFNYAFEYKKDEMVKNWFKGF